MASFQRVALFILFDSIERDLVNWIDRASQSLPKLSLEEQQIARGRLAKKEQGLYNLDDPHDLLFGLDITTKYDILLRHKDGLSSLDRDYFFSINQNIISVLPIRNDIMHGRHLTLLEHTSAFEFANLLRTHPEHWPLLCHALKQFQEDPTSFLTKTVTFFDEPTFTEVLNNLPNPDYDDTGFLSRPELEADLAKKIRGRHPVVTVLGEGGNGKTALALRVLYSMVKSADHQFDAILWSTAKTTKLTETGLQEIRSNITEGEIIEELSALENVGTTPLERLHNLLQNNRILLVIDNFETISGGDLVQLAGDVPGQSKLLFTSRIPVGGDLTILVPEFSPKDANIYFWRLVDAYSVNSLRGQPQVPDWLASLAYKPLLIKWFVLGVKAGLTPDRIIQNQDEALRFCLENVVLNLGVEAQAVVVVLATLSSKVSQGIIQVCSGLSSTQVSDGISELMRFGLIDSQVDDDGTSEFSIKPFTQSYIHRLLPQRRERIDSILGRFRSFDLEFKSEANAGHYNPYSLRNFKVRSKSDYIIARKLKDASRFAFAGEFEMAEMLLAESRILDPLYFETCRVESTIAQQQGNYVRALNSMKTAIELAPNEPQLHFFLGGLLMRNHQNDEAAISFELARELDPNSGAILREHARNEYLRFNFERAQELLDECFSKSYRSDKERTITNDLQVQNFGREVVLKVRRGEFDLASATMNRLIGFLRSLDPRDTDSRLWKGLFENIIAVVRFRGRLSVSPEDWEFVNDCLRENFDKDMDIISSPVREGAYLGVLKLSGRKPNFGFIEGSFGDDVFVHRDSCSAQTWERMLVGCAVRYDVEVRFDGKPKAKNLSINDYD